MQYQFECLSALKSVVNIQKPFEKLKRSLKCCQNEWLSMKKCAEKSVLTC